MFYYAANSTISAPDAVREWFSTSQKLKPHGHIRVKGRWGDVYQVGKLMSELDRTWPSVVHDWLRTRSGMPEALVVVWTPEG